MNKITAYLSHTIRGKKGKTASKEDMDENCEKAKKAANWLRENIPDLELYVPAEHEDFVQLAYLEEYLTEQQILAIDCKILAQKTDFQIVLDEEGWRGGGIAVEIDAAINASMSIFYMDKMDDTTLLLLNQMIDEVLRMKQSNLYRTATELQIRAQQLRKQAAELYDKEE